jgi:hypothetical protein
MEIAELSIPIRERDLSSSGVSWGAVTGGAFVTAALSVIMLALGAGFGLSSVSPWSNVGIAASTAGSIAIIWLILTEIVACAMGGYLAGRLRTKWHTIHNDEVHFRDTANGFLSWAVAVVLTMAFLGAAAVSMAGGAVASDQVSTSAGGAAKVQAGTAYFIDRLFRSDHPATDNDSALRGEAGRIFSRVLLRDDSAAADIAYLAQMVTAKTGLSTNDAAKRVSDTIADARQAEDTARKATAHFLLWIFLALLIGAFCASYAATIGGRQRDYVKVV